MNGERTIAVDVGNSAIKLAWLEVGKMRMLAFPLRDRKWPESLVREIAALRKPSAAETAAGELAPVEAFRWLAASVNRPAAASLLQLVAAEFPQDRWSELTRTDIDLPIRIRQPETVGIDRLLGARGALRAAEALAAAQQISGTQLQEEPPPQTETEQQSVISVDAGSAVTVDLVRDGQFEGGAILPGIRLQLGVLNQATDRLPEVSGEDRQSLEVPGKDTISAIRCGVLHGIAGAIDRLIELSSNDLPMPPVVVLTGGDAALLQPLIRHKSFHHEGLVLSAILEIAGSQALSPVSMGNREPQNVSFD